MSNACRIKVSIQPEDFDLAGEMDDMRAGGHTDIGAIATFTGICRSEDNTLAALELEHYPGMAEQELARLTEEAKGRWPLQAITIIHRHGKIPVGENIVLVIAASSHRAAAFDGAMFLMDYLKTRAPFWKKEHFVDGGAGGWIDAKDIDDAAAERWEMA